MALVPIILSGGAGARLWPLSREAAPKPFLPLPADGADGDTLLDGSEFKVAQVIDATHSIARIPKGLSKLGAKNNRFVVHLIPWP